MKPELGDDAGDKGRRGCEEEGDMDKPKEMLEEPEAQRPASLWD